MIQFARTYVESTTAPSAALTHILSHVTPEQLRLASAVRIDGWSAAKVADREGISRATVTRAVAILDTTLKHLKLELPPPKRSRSSRHVRQIPNAIIKML